MARMFRSYKFNSRRRLGLRLGIVVLILAVLVTVVVVETRHIYKKDLAPVSTSQKTQLFTIKSGATVKSIADDLETQHLIRSAWALRVYVHGRGLDGKFQAGTYALSPDQGTISIVRTLTKGKVLSGLVTILPGRRIDQVRADLINDGFSPEEVDKALDPAQYADLPVMAFKPADVNTLEGLLWPDSWDKDTTTPASDIIRQSLQAMGDQLTPDIQAAFAAQGLSPYQGITLASVVVQEVNKPTDQSQAAQVFLRRIREGSLLQSDVTARYGAIAAGLAPSLTYDSPYNTHLHKGLPPTPISTISESALQAAAHPASTNWLYFVTGDDGTTYFASTLQQHEANAQKYCHKLCSQ
jgi:UPF0755 protein